MPSEAGPEPGPEPAAPAPEPAAPPSAATGASERHRLHPVSILFLLGAQARSLLVPGLFVLFAARGSDDPSVWMMVLFFPYAAVAVVRYLSFRYAYLADELVIESGFVFRKRRHVPYGRIHNIASVENPLHRAFGVAEVRVETAGGDEPEARIRVLSREALEEMRRRVAAGKARRPGGTAEGAAAGAAGAEAGGGGAGASAPAAGAASAAGVSPAAAPAIAAVPARDLVRLGPKDLVLYGLIDNRGMVVAGALLGVAWQLGLFDAGGRAGARRSFEWWRAWQEVPSAGLELFWDSVRSGASPLRIALGVAAALAVFLVLVRLLSIGWAFYKLWGFRLRLSGRELASESGLLTRVRAAVPLHRIQTVTVTESPLHRLLRRVEVTAETAGGKSGEDAAGGKERQRLAPILRRAELPALIGELLPGLDLGAVEWRPVDPRGEVRMRRAGLVWSAIWAAAAAIGARAAGISPWWALAVFALLALQAAWMARRRIRRYGWALTGDAVLFRSGGLWRRTTMARDSKVQAAALAEGPLDRLWGMATLALDTAGAAATSHRLHVPFLPRETARELLEEVDRRAATTAFRW